MVAVAALAVMAGGSTACATKKFVTNQVGQVSTKVDSLSKSLEETQEATKRNEARIGEVDQATKAAQGSADKAQQSAMATDSKASGAAESARTAGMKADAVEKASRKIVYEVALSEDSGNFKFGQATLPDESKAKLDEMINKILADPKGAYFEIEGHTDNVGAPEVNKALGLQRADAVKQYLYDQFKIPLHRMNVISYGEDKPVGDNKTKDGRAQNRRVVIRVLG
jgi:outer membrane protein OmpA-like peptidoglycan-associated protein